MVVADYQMVMDTSGVIPDPRKTRQISNDKQVVDETQKEKRIARKATNELKNTGAKSKFDKGVANVSDKRKTRMKPVPAPRTIDAKNKPYLVDYYIHEFKNYVVVRWKGYPLKESTREPKSVQREGMGVVQFAKEIADLKQNKVARKTEYKEWVEANTTK